jgi:rod shape-determining protein MreC
MNRFSAMLSARRRSLSLGLVIALSLFLLYGPPAVPDFVSQLFIRTIYYPFYQMRIGFSQITIRSSVNDRLQEALTESSLRVSELEEMRRENERFRDALGFEPPAAYHLTPAKVNFVVGDPVPTTATVNKGARHGVIVNQAVIDRYGLLGKVVTVSGDNSVIQLLTDPSNRVAVRSATSREMGIIKYSVSRGMFLDNFPVEGTIKTGDTIITSGLGGVYPPGLLVGTVSGVEYPTDRPFCDVSVRPFVNMYAIEELFILKVDKQ